MECLARRTHLIFPSPYSRHGELVTLGEDDVGRGVESLGDVPHAIGKLQLLDSLIRHMPEDEPIENCGTAPLLVLKVKFIK